MKKLATAFALISLVLATAAAYAHDGAHGMKGTVTAINDDTITIETPAKETQQVHFDATTKFQKSGAAASVKDLKVGDRVVIEATDADGKMHAAQVRFGKPAKGTKGKSHAAHGEKSAVEKH
jgi:hypothetical protein